MFRLRAELSAVMTAKLISCASACALVILLAAPVPSAFAEEAVPAGLAEQAESLGDLLPSSGSGSSNPASKVIGQVEKVAFGSQGATVTLEGGKQIRLDFSGLTGVSGGPNYIGWAMVLFGMSVATRLLSSLARVLRPITRASNMSRMARRARYDDDEY